MGTIKDTLGRSTVEEREIAQDAIDRAGLQIIAKWGGVTHQSTIYFDPKLPPEPEEMNRIFGKHSLSVSMEDVRTNIYRSEQLLSDRGWPTESTADRTLPERIYGLGFTPLDEEAIAAEIVFFGREILKAPELFKLPKKNWPAIWSVIQNAISYEQAIYRRDHFAVFTRKQSQSARQKRSVAVRDAVAAWSADHPDQTGPQKFSSLRLRRPENPTAGKHWIWRKGDAEFIVLDPESGKELIRKKSTFLNLISKMKNK